MFADTGANDYHLQPTSPALTAGPDGGRIGWLGFPSGEVCTGDGECDDANLCTTDACTLGVCEYTPIIGCIACAVDEDCEYGNLCAIGTCDVDGRCVFSPTSEGASCDDGWNCTTDDTCTNGVCIGSEDCPAGLVCDPDTGGECGGRSVLVFQQGLSGYGGTHDTFLREASPGSNYGAVDNWEWDGEDGAGENIGLIRFGDMFGSGYGRIQAGSTITSAMLTLEAFDESVPPAGAVHLALDDWDESTVVWNSYGGEAGVQPDEIGDLVSDAPVSTGRHEIDVTSSVAGVVHGPVEQPRLDFLAECIERLAGAVERIHVTGFAPQADRAVRRILH